MKNNTKSGYRNKSVIAIHGDNNVGKDTVANMLFYMIKDKDNSNFSDWFDFYEGNIWYNDKVFDILSNNKSKNYIFAYANYLKESLAYLYDIDFSKLNNRLYKDVLYYDLIKKEFVENINDNDILININKLKYKSLSNYIIEAKDYNKNIFIKLRDLMLYYGDLMAKNISNTLWIDKLNNDVINSNNEENIAIISDVRFNAELKDITNYDKYLYIIIKNENDNTIVSLTKQFISSFTKEDHHIGTIVLHNDKISLKKLYDEVYKIYKYTVHPKMIEV